MLCLPDLSAVIVGEYLLPSCIIVFYLMHCCVSQQRCLWDGHVMWDAMCLENIKNN